MKRIYENVCNKKKIMDSYNQIWETIAAKKEEARKKKEANK